MALQWSSLVAGDVARGAAVNFDLGNLNGSAASTSRDDGSAATSGAAVRASGLLGLSNDLYTRDERRMEKTNVAQVQRHGQIRLSC